MPSDDLIINVRQINGYPFVQNAGYGDAILLQTSQGGPYYQMSVQGAVASALAVDFNRGLSVGAGLPPGGTGGNILAGQAFVSPLNRGMLFNCFFSDAGPWQPGLNYLVSDVAGALLFSEAGFAFMGYPVGMSLTPILSEAAACLISRTGQMALREQLTVGREPIGPTEVVNLSYFTAHAIVRNPGNGKLNLTTEDIVNAGGATHVNAALAGYPTAEHPVPDAHDHEITTAAWVRNYGQTGLCHSWNGRKGDVCLNVMDIVYAGGAPVYSPIFVGNPTAPTPPEGDDSQSLATTDWVHTAMANAAVGTANVPTDTNPPAGPVEGDLWYNPASGRLNVYTQGSWVVLQ